MQELRANNTVLKSIKFTEEDLKKDPRTLERTKLKKQWLRRVLTFLSGSLVLIFILTGMMGLEKILGITMPTSLVLSTLLVVGLFAIGTGLDFNAHYCHQQIFTLSEILLTKKEVIDKENLQKTNNHLKSRYLLQDAPLEFFCILPLVRSAGVVFTLWILLAIPQYNFDDTPIDPLNFLFKSLLILLALSFYQVLGSGRSPLGNCPHIQRSNRSNDLFLFL